MLRLKSNRKYGTREHVQEFSGGCRHARCGCRSVTLSWRTEGKLSSERKLLCLIHSFHFYNAPSSPLLLKHSRHSTDKLTDMCQSFTPKHQLCLNLTLKMAADYIFPFTQTFQPQILSEPVWSKQLGLGLLLFFATFEWFDVSAARSLLFANDKVGRGQGHSSLVTRALTYFSKLTGKDSHLQPICSVSTTRMYRTAECIEKLVGNWNYGNEVRQ